MKLEIEDRWREYAKKESTGKKFNDSTIREGGAGQYTGTIGEMAFGRYLLDAGLPFKYVAKDSFDHDFQIFNYSVDVKSKKSVGEPKKNYMVRIPDSQKTQDSDLYVFSYVTPEFVTFLGWMDKQEFWSGQKTFSIKAGDIVDGFVEKVDCRYTFVGELNDFDTFELLFVPH